MTILILYVNIMKLCELAEQEIIYQILLFKFLEAVEKEDAQNVAILQPAFDISVNHLKRLPIIGSHVTIDCSIWVIDFILLLPYEIKVVISVPHETITDGSIVLYSISIGNSIVMHPIRIPIGVLVETLQETLKDINDGKDNAKNN